MKAAILMLLVAVAACGGDNGADGPPDCTVGIAFSPASPIAGPQSEVRAIAYTSSVPGVRTYAWTVARGGASVPFDDARTDRSEIVFIADQPGVYDVTLDVAIPGYACSTAFESVTARASDSGRLVRLHISPLDGTAAPPYDQIIEVPDSPDFDLGEINLDPGTNLTGTVSSGATGVPAYLRFSPVANPDAAVEVFTDADGTYSARLAKVAHDILIVPTGPYAPRKTSWALFGSGELAVDGGEAVTGTVLDPSGAALAGAKVKALIDGVPSTIATTAADGSYSLQVSAFGDDVTIEVVPPLASGLPRLSLRTSLDLQAPIDVRYASTLALRDLAGMQLRRGGSPLAGGKVTVVGEIATAGTIAGAPALGHVRVAATANASGTLPSALVPAAPLDGVIAASPTDLAVVPLDLSTAVPAQLTAPSMLSIDTTIMNAGAGVERARLELVPREALALAGVSSSYLVAGATGVVTGQLASGGTYDLLVTDPAGDGAPLVVRNVTASNLTSTYVLPEAVHVSGVAGVTGNPNPLVGASVQVLCAQCEGVERARPLAEGATDQGGAFTLAVPKPAL